MTEPQPDAGWVGLVVVYCWLGVCLLIAAGFIDECGSSPFEPVCAILGL